MSRQRYRLVGCRKVAAVVALAGLGLGRLGLLKQRLLGRGRAAAR